MKYLLKITTLLFTLFTYSVVFTNAQDVIVKNDSTKTKTKDVEITEAIIKYKNWENQDGLLYNIALNEVNMIIYENGQKEIIKPSNNILPETQANTNDLKNQKVIYKPNRLVIGLQSPLSFGGDKEFRIVKNIFNLGLGTYLYSTPENDLMPYSFLYSAYGSFYAPINRLLKNYQKQNKGLFIFAHAGYGLSLIAEYDEFENPQLITSGGFLWRMGMDYYFVKGFGFTVSAFEFKTFYGGIVFSFN